MRHSDVIMVRTQQRRRRPILLIPAPARALLVMLLLVAGANHPCYDASLSVTAAAAGASAAAAAAVSCHPDPYVQRHRERARVRRRLQSLYFDGKAGNDNGGKCGSTSIFSLLGRIGNAMHAKLTGGTMQQQQQHRQPGTKFTLRFPTQDVANEMYSGIISPSIPVQFNHDCVGMTKPDVVISSSQRRRRRSTKARSQGRRSIMIMPAQALATTPSTDMGGQILLTDSNRMTGLETRRRRIRGVGEYCATGGAWDTVDVATMKSRGPCSIGSLVRLMKPILLLVEAGTMGKEVALEVAAAAAAAAAADRRQWASYERGVRPNLLRLLRGE